MRNFVKRPVIVCEQRRAEKKIVTEKDLIQSNIDGYGDMIGVITNRTSARNVIRSKFPKGSREYEELTRRVSFGELAQQDAIDKAKGIITKDLPAYWHSRKKILQSDMSEEEKQFQLSIVADKKAYFQKYIYSSLKKKCREYDMNTKKKALRLFRKDIDELKATPEDELTPDEKQFLSDYELYNPVVDGTDTVNRICHRVEREFQSYVVRRKAETEFDYTILKSDKNYKGNHLPEIREIYMEYKMRAETYAKTAKKNRVDSYDANEQFTLMRDDFKRRCEEVCPNSEMLCDIIIDITYARERSRQFAWDVCGEQIIQNLLKKNDYMINMPVRDDEGDITFKGRTYRVDRVPYIQEEEEITYAN